MTRRVALDAVQVSGAPNKLDAANRTRTLAYLVVANPVSIVALLSATSAALAFVRDALFGSAFGVNADSDAYFVAFLIMNTSVLLVASGSLAVSVPPVLPSKTTHRDSPRHATAGALLVVSGVPLVGLAGLMVIAAPALVMWLAPGLEVAERILATNILRVFAPALVFSGLAVVGTRILQASDRFALAGLANLVAVFPPILVLLWPALDLTSMPVAAIALAVTLGTFLQLAVVLWALRNEVAVPCMSTVGRTARQMWAIVGPLLLYNCLAYSLVLLERAIASTLGPGTIATFTYASRIFGLAGLLYITPLATVFYPRFAERQRENIVRAAAYLADWLSMAAGLGGLATAIFVASSYQLVTVVYGRGQFAGEAAESTSVILGIYALATVPTSVSALLHAACFASGLTWVVTLVSAIDFAVYAAASIVLARLAGPSGLAAAQVLSYWLVLLLVLAFSYQRLQLSLAAVLRSVMLGTCAALLAIAASSTLALPFTGTALPAAVGLVSRGAVTCLAYGIILTALFIVSYGRTWPRAVVHRAP